MTAPRLRRCAATAALFCAAFGAQVPTSLAAQGAAPPGPAATGASRNGLATADRAQATNVESDRMHHDDARGITTFTGNVVLTRGNARIQGERLTITQDKAGNQIAQTSGNPAVFRQRREGSAQVIEGFGQRIDYDSRNERVTLNGQARINRLLCDRPADSISGGTIVYDARTEVTTVDGQRNASQQVRRGDDGAAGSRGRVRVVIQPRQSGSEGGGRTAPEPECGSADALRLQPAPALVNPPAPQPEPPVAGPAP